MGHLLEVCEGSNVSIVNYSKVPVFKEIHDYIDKKMRPWGTLRNWIVTVSKPNIENEKQRHILCDPQTSGGLLIAVKKEAAQKSESILKKWGFMLNQ
jgi:selenide,water dikinase